MHPGPWQVQTILVEVDDVEVVGLADGGFQGQDLLGHRVSDSLDRGAT
jgi:hypothetical protein